MYWGPETEEREYRPQILKCYLNFMRHQNFTLVIIDHSILNLIIITDNIIIHEGEGSPSSSIITKNIIIIIIMGVKDGQGLEPDLEAYVGLGQTV